MSKDIKLASLHWHKSSSNFARLGGRVSSGSAINGATPFSLLIRGAQYV